MPVRVEASRLARFLEELKRTGDPRVAAERLGIDQALVPLYLAALKSLGLAREPPSPSCACDRCPFRRVCPLAAAARAVTRARSASSPSRGGG